MCYVSKPSVTVTKYLIKTSREERLILAYIFRHFSPCSAGSIAFGPAVKQNTKAGSRGETYG
jgi:hypothetical protein